jgi:hypothetical protein
VSSDDCPWTTLASNSNSDRLAAAATTNTCSRQAVSTTELVMCSSTCSTMPSMDVRRRSAVTLKLAYESHAFAVDNGDVGNVPVRIHVRLDHEFANLDSTNKTRSAVFIRPAIVELTMSFAIGASAGFDKTVVQRQIVSDAVLPRFVDVFSKISISTMKISFDDRSFSVRLNR